MKISFNKFSGIFKKSDSKKQNKVEIKNIQTFVSLINSTGSWIELSQFNGAVIKHLEDNKLVQKNTSAELDTASSRYKQLKGIVQNFDKSVLDTIDFLSERQATKLFMAIVQPDVNQAKRYYDSQEKLQQMDLDFLAFKARLLNQLAS